jgi:hypothetical protein
MKNAFQNHYLYSLQSKQKQGGFAFIVLLSISISLVLAGNLLIQRYATSNQQISNQILQQQLRASAESAADLMRLRLHAALISTSPVTFTNDATASANPYVNNCSARLNLDVANVQSGGSGSSNVSFSANQVATNSPNPNTNATSALVSHTQTDHYIIIACAHQPSSITGQVVAVSQTLKLEQGGLINLGWQQR